MASTSLCDSDLVLDNTAPMEDWRMGGDRVARILWSQGPWTKFAPMSFQCPQIRNRPLSGHILS